MEKKKRPNEYTCFYRNSEFFLTPAEFLAMVWVYRNEILPTFKRCSAAEPKSIEDMNELIFRIRHCVLNGDLQEEPFDQQELSAFVHQSNSLFAPFADSTDVVTKPPKELVTFARHLLTDLIVCDEIGNLAELNSSLVNGSISFKLSKMVLRP